MDGAVWIERILDHDGVLSWLCKAGPNVNIVVFHFSRKVLCALWQIDHFRVVWVLQTSIDVVAEIQVHAQCDVVSDVDFVLKVKLDHVPHVVAFLRRVCVRLLKNMANPPATAGRILKHIGHGHGPRVRYQAWRGDHRRYPSPVVGAHMLVEELHQPASHAVKQLVLNVLPSVVEEQGVSPFFADVALVSGADLPAHDIVFVEQVELLVTNHPDQDELIVDFAAPTNPLELGALHLELLPLQLCHFLRQIPHIRLPRNHI